MANLGILQLPSALADAHGLPRGDRFRRQPQGDVASLDQCSVVRRPVFRRGISFCTWDALSTSRRDHAPSAVTMARAATNTCYRAPTPREPEGDVASPHEGSVVLGPVPDAIRCRVLRMHSRLHIEIMTRRRSRWSTCRPLLAHRAESAHQRPTPGHWRPTGV